MIFDSIMNDLLRRRPLADILLQWPHQYQDDMFLTGCTPSRRTAKKAADNKRLKHHGREAEYYDVFLRPH
jgi:hypothetical protein